HISLPTIGSVARPRGGLCYFQHHDVLAVGYFSQLISYFFSADVAGLGRYQPKSRNPVPPPQISRPHPFNEGAVFGQSHVFDGHRKPTLHCWLSLCWLSLLC